MMQVAENSCCDRMKVLALSVVKERWEEYTCDSILSDTVGMWVKELTGMTKEEMENAHEHL